MHDHTQTYAYFKWNAHELPIPRQFVCACDYEHIWYDGVIATEQDSQRIVNYLNWVGYAHYEIIAVCIWIAYKRVRWFHCVKLKKKNNKQTNKKHTEKRTTTYTSITDRTHWIQNASPNTANTQYKISQNIEFQHFIASVENSYNFHHDFSHISSSQTQKWVFAVGSKRKKQKGRKEKESEKSDTHTHPYFSTVHTNVKNTKASFLWLIFNLPADDDTKNRISWAEIVARDCGQNISVKLKFCLLFRFRFEFTCVQMAGISNDFPFQLVFWFIHFIGIIFRWFIPLYIVNTWELIFVRVLWKIESIKFSAQKSELQSQFWNRLKKDLFGLCGARNGFKSFGYFFGAKSRPKFDENLVSSSIERSRLNFNNKLDAIIEK